MAGSIIFGYRSHPPLLVPEGGGSRINSVDEFAIALREFSRRLIEARPETVVVISPHSPLDPKFFTARSGHHCSRRLSRFSRAGCETQFENDLELLDALKHAAGGGRREARRACAQITRSIMARWSRFTTCMKRAGEGR